MVDCSHLVLHVDKVCGFFSTDQVCEQRLVLNKPFVGTEATLEEVEPIKKGICRLAWVVAMGIKKLINLWRRRKT